MSLIPFLGRRKVKIAKGLLEFVELDATLSEAHSFDTQITDHPVETGANISDHIRSLPIKLHLSGVVSNQPLALTQINLNPNRAEEALGTLVQWQLDAELLTITTTLTTYESLVLKSVSLKRDKTTGNVAAMEMDFQEIKQVTSAYADVEPKTDVISAKPPKAKGKVVAKPKIIPKSVLSKALGVGA